MEAEALQQLKNELVQQAQASLKAAFDSKLEGLQAEIATLRERNVELLAQAEKNSQSGEQQLQAQQAHMQMQLIQQARVETDKFRKAVEQMATQFSSKKGHLQVPTLQAKQQLMQQFTAMTSLLASVSSVARLSGEQAAEDLVVDPAVLSLIQGSLAPDTVFKSQMTLKDAIREQEMENKVT
jgi:hypothetical protein